MNLYYHKTNANIQSDFYISKDFYCSSYIYGTSPVKRSRVSKWETWGNRYGKFPTRGTFW